MRVRPIDMEEIEAVANSFKDDLMRECERKVRRGDNPGALSAIQGKEYIDKFVDTLRMKAVSDIGRPARARPIHIFKKAGS